MLYKLEDILFTPQVIIWYLGLSEKASSVHLFKLFLALDAAFVRFLHEPNV